MVAYASGDPCNAQAADGSDTAPARVERDLIGNLRSQLKYNEFRNNIELRRNSSFQLLVANNVRYHTGLFSSPSGDISSAVKERCAALGGAYATGGDAINPGTLLISREENPRLLANGVTVNSGNKVQTFSCNKDENVIIQAILAYNGSRTAGGNVFAADFYDLRVLEKTGDFASADDRKRFLVNAAAIGSQTASTEVAAFEATERAVREKEQQIRIQLAAAERAKRDAIQKAEEEARLRDLEARLPAFRASLKIGDDTNCGLVVEVRRPIAKIQTPTGERWLKIDRLQGVGGELCYESGELATGARSDIRSGTGLIPGTHVTRQFSGVTSLGRGACGPDASPSFGGCSGNVRVTGVVEQSSGSRVQIRISTSVVAEESRLRVPFNSDLGRIEAGSVIWDEVVNWTAIR
jgi:ribosomal protein L29